MQHDIVVVGSVNADLVLEVPRHPHPGETLLGHAISVLPGGKGANQAVAAARLGARVAMVGAVGTDVYADPALAELSSAGVDLSGVRRVAGPTGLAVVTVADDAENSIVVIAGANATTDEAAVASAADTIAGAAVCVLQAEIPLDGVIRAARIAHDAGRRVVLNVAPACQLPVETLRQADPLVVNEHEAAILLDTPGIAGEDALNGLALLGIPSVVLTLGAAGVVGVDGDGSWALPARAVTPRDTTGAGDAFVGALAVGLARGESVRDAALLATRVAAASVQHLGAQPSYPWKDDVLP